MMRIKTEVWVKAYLRRVMAEGVAAYVAARGDDFAGAVYIHVDDLQGGHLLFGPAPAGLSGSEEERRWVACFEQGCVNREQAEDYLAAQKKYDPDLWIIELEDRQSRHFLGDLLQQLR